MESADGLSFIKKRSMLTVDSKLGLMQRAGIHATIAAQKAH